MSLSEFKFKPKALEKEFDSVRDKIRDDMTLIYNQFNGTKTEEQIRLQNEAGAIENLMADLTLAVANLLEKNFDEAKTFFSKIDEPITQYLNRRTKLLKQILKITKVR